MASTDHKKFKTTSSSKGEGVTVTSDSLVLPPDSEDHVLSVTVDNSCTGTVDVELEMSPDGTNWCPAVSKKVESGTSSTGDIIGNEKNVKLTPDGGENKNKYGKGLLTKNLGTDTAGSEADFMYHRIQTTKSFNYSQWIKSSEAPSATYSPVLFRHAGYDNFSNAKTIELTTTGSGSTDIANLKDPMNLSYEWQNVITSGLRPHDSFTVAYWVDASKLDAGTTHYPGFANTENNSSGDFGVNGADIIYNNASGGSSNRYYVSLHWRSGPQAANQLDYFTVDRNEAYLIVKRVDASAGNGGTGYIYLDAFKQSDGSSVFNEQTTYTIDTSYTAEFGAFNSAVWDAQSGVGKIDELIMLNSCVTDGNLNTLYQTIDSKIYPKDFSSTSGALAWYRFSGTDSKATVTSAVSTSFGILENTSFTSSDAIPALATTDKLYMAGQIKATQNLCTTSLSGVFDTSVNTSISGWFKTTGTGVLFSNTEGAVTDGLKMEVNDSNMVLTLIDSSQTVTATADVNDGNWHHVVVTKPSGTTPTIKIYVDGVEKVSTTVSTISNDDLRGDNGFTLLGDGQENKNATNPSSEDSSKLQATLSNWSLHTETLSANAVLQLYSNGNVRNIKNLPDVATASISHWYQFNDTSNPINDIVGTNHLLYQGPTTDVNTKAIKASTQTTAANAATRDFVLNGNKNPFANDNNMPLLSSAFSMSFWLYIPSGSSTWDSIIAFSATDTRNHFKLHNISNNLSFSFTGGGEGADYSIDYSGNHDAWKHIVMIKPADTVENLAVFVNGVKKAVTQTYFTGDMADPATTSWGTEGSRQGCSEFFIFGNSRAYTSSNSSGDFGSDRSGRVFKIDHLGTYSKALTYGGVSNNQTATGEVAAIYNSGNYIDLSTLAGSYNLEKYFKFGDHSSDVTSGTLKYYDEVNDAAYFEEQDNTNGGTVTLTSSDAPYHAPIENITTRQINATGATLIADGINGHGMTMSITKSFNFTTKKWVSTSDQDAAICLSFNGFQDQAEYFALWKCSQTLAGSAVNVLDGGYHNIILSYRGRNDFSSDNVDPGDEVKFGPGDSNQNYNWTLSIDGVETTTINDGSGVDYIGGLNTLSTATYNSTTYNVGFAIQDRHLKHTNGNTEEVYKPHTQFSSGILDSGGSDNVHAFQGVVDETSFHSDCWWVDSSGTSIVANNFNGEKPATIYGNTTALSNRGAGKEYPVGKPYPLRNPEKLVTTGAASDIVGTNQYINPNPFDESSNPKGGLEGFWRWGDTPGDCSVTINDAKSHADGNNNNDLSAENLTTADVITLTSADSTYLASSTASSGGTTISFPQVKISAIQAGICNIKQMESQILQYLRVKFTGAGSCDLGEGKGQASIHFTKRRKR